MSGSIPVRAVNTFIDPNNASGMKKQARIAQQMAEAEQSARQVVTGEARSARDRMNLAAQSPQELAALERGLSFAQKQVDSDERLLAAIDPAILEASQQAYNILKGDTAGANKPATALRAQQRQQLVNQLRNQMGPGAESSSAGQRMLQQFDMQSASMFQQNQQSALGQLFGMGTTRVQGQGFGNLMNVAGGFGSRASRLFGAEQAGSQNVLAALGSEVQGSGAQFVQAGLQADFQRSKYNQLSSDMRSMGRAWGSRGKGGGGSSQPGENAGLQGYGGDTASLQGSQSASDHGGSFGQRGM